MENQLTTFTEPKRLMYELFGSIGYRTDILEEYCNLGEEGVQFAEAEYRKFIVDTVSYYDVFPEAPIFLFLYLGFNKKSFDLHCRLLEFSSDTIEVFFNMIFTEEAPQVLFLSFDGNIDKLASIAQNELINPYHRISAIHAINLLYADSQISSEQLLVVFTNICRRILNTDTVEYNDLSFRTLFAAHAIDAGFKVIDEYIHQMYKENLLDEKFCAYAEAQTLMDLAEDKRATTIKEQCTIIKGRTLSSIFDKYFHSQFGSDEEVKRKSRNQRKKHNRKR